MKILIITHYFIPHTGGIEVVAFNQAANLVKKGHQVTIVTSKIAKEEERSSVAGIKVIRVKALNTLEKMFGVPFPIFSPKIISILKKEVEQADLVHIHGHVYLSSLIATYFANKFSKPIVLTQHNTFINYKNPLFRFLQKVADYSIGKYTIKKATKVIAVSHKTKDYINSILNAEKKIQVSYNGVDVARFNLNKNKSKDLFKQYKDKFICLCIRRITFKNGIDTILETAKLLKNNSNIIFLIGGKGPDLKKLSKYIAQNKLSNVKLLGFISDKELPKYYSLADVFILPSKEGEGFPLVVLESFSSGLPVIATKSGGHVDVIRNNKNGYLVNVSDHKQIAHRIIQLYENKQLLKEMSINSRKLAKNNFSWTKNVANLNSVYREAINQWI